jgi:hypothetical protein
VVHSLPTFRLQYVVNRILNSVLPRGVCRVLTFSR